MLRWGRTSRRLVATGCAEMERSLEGVDGGREAGEAGGEGSGEQDVPDKRADDEQIERADTVGGPRNRRHR